MRYILLNILFLFFMFCTPAAFAVEAGFAVGGEYAMGADLMFVQDKDSSNGNNEAKHANPAELLSKMTDALEVNNSMDLIFELAITDQDGTVMGSFDGEVYAQGYSFKLINPQLEVYSDSESKWILNLDNKELTIVPNDTTQVDLVENPIGFLLSLSKGNDQFKYPSKAVDTRKPDNGKSLWSIELEPVNKYMPYKLVTLCLDKETNLPSVIMYKSRDGSAYTIFIKSIEGAEVRPTSFFKFPQERLAEFTVTDLR